MRRPGDGRPDTHHAIRDLGFRHQLAEIGNPETQRVAVAQVAPIQPVYGYHQQPVRGGLRRACQQGAHASRRQYCLELHHFSPSCPSVEHGDRRPAKTCFYRCRPGVALRSNRKIRRGIMKVIRKFAAVLLGASILTPLPSVAVAPQDYKQEAIANIDSHAKMVQVMVDTLFSYGDPGFQEFRTSAYITDILAKNGFKITKGVAGIPTAWTATWGEGGPLIALGSDEDDLRGVSQIPGDPKVE